MSTPQLGKVSRGLFDALIAPRLGAARPEQVLVGPRHGVDVGVVRVAPGVAMAVTSDPLSLIPSLGVEESAWLSVHLLASDVTTSGLEPAFAVMNFNLPPAMDDAQLARYWEKVHQELDALGVTVIGGHTGRYLGCDYTIIGAGVMMAVGPERDYVCSATAQAGDAVVITKGAAIAATGLLARMFPETARTVLGEAGARQARELFWQFGTVREARVAARFGLRERGVHAMHDATEGGVYGALAELAQASGLGLVVREPAVPVSDEARGLCRRFFEMDPYTALSEGTLVLAVAPERVGELVAAMAAEGIMAAEVGRLLAPGEGLWIEGADGRRRPLVPPAADPYWEAYARAVAAGWR